MPYAYTTNISPRSYYSSLSLSLFILTIPTISLFASHPFRIGLQNFGIDLNIREVDDLFTILGKYGLSSVRYSQFYLINEIVLYC